MPLHPLSPTGFAQHTGIARSLVLASALTLGSVAFAAAEQAVTAPSDQSLQTPELDPLQIEQRSASEQPSIYLGGGIEGDEGDAGGDLRHIESQIEVGELPEARRALETRLTELQQTGDRYDSAMIEPLRLLGQVYHKLGEYPAAAETLALATQISRVNFGLHSKQQLALVHQEIASLKAMGNILEANRRHEYAFSIARRHYGRYAEELIPELLKIASWYTSTGDVIGARDRYAEARLLLSAQAETATSDTMIHTLRGIAKSYRDEFYPPFYSRTDKETTEFLASRGLNDRQNRMREEMNARVYVNRTRPGTEALRDIVQIEGQRLANLQRVLRASNATNAGAAADSNADAGSSEENPTAALMVEARGRQATGLNMEQISEVISSPDVDKSRFINALLELADWHLLMGKEPRAFGYYQHVFNIASQDPNTDVTELLGSPTLLYFPRPRDPKLPGGAPPESIEQGHVELTYDVDHRGSIRKVRTLDSQPKGMMDFHVRSSAKLARYRPRIIDGLPQPAPAQVYRHSFNYFPRGRETNPTRVIDTDVATSEGDAPTGE